MDILLGFGLPANKVVYYKPGQAILNATDLQQETDLVNEIIPVQGEITGNYGVNPIVVATDRGTYHLLYAPSGTDRVFDSEGGSPNFGKVLSSLEIVIPDRDLKPIRLAPANTISFNRFVDSQSLLPGSPEPMSYDDSVLIQEIQNIKQKLETPSRDPEVLSLKRDVAQLYDILDALIRRVYSLYPINRLQPMRIGGVDLTEISLDEYERMRKRGEILEDRIDPLLQPYISSHRSNNRIKTVISKNGKGYFVQCFIDPVTKNISGPQFKES